MGSLAALMLAALACIALISIKQKRVIPSVKITLDPLTERTPFRIFRGQQLCGEGESYCKDYLASWFVDLDTDQHECFRRASL